LNLDEVIKHISDFVNHYKNELYNLTQNESKALELAGTIAVCEHYKYLGYSIEIVNPDKAKNVFCVKTSTRGFPWNFSHIKILKENINYEIHTNLSVKSCHDDGVYCVDIGIIKEDSILKDEKKWKCVENSNLLSFGEVKKLVIYPMLLAQFIGIVHEIRPEYLAMEIKPEGIFEPVLISLGNFSGNSTTIVKAYEKRKIKLFIAQDFDIRLANYRGKNVQTPFYGNDF